MKDTFLHILLSLCIIFGFIQPATAMIDIVPQKIVMEARDRNADFTILNLYNKTGTFRVELLSYRQDENGIYQKLESPLNSDFDPNNIVRFSPRQFTLEPGAKQKVRLLIRKPGNLPDGEYRFHVKTSRFASDEERKENQGSVSIVMNTGIVIPVVVRHGKTFSDAKITQANMTQSGNEMVIDVEREGSASTIGQLNIYEINGIKEEKIGTISNANIFEEITQRRFKVPLKKRPDSEVVIRYSDEVQKGKIFDEMSVSF